MYLIVLQFNLTNDHIFQHVLLERDIFDSEITKSDDVTFFRPKPVSFQLKKKQNKDV